MRRGKFQGVATIVRFNWPFYLMVAAIAIAAVCGLWLLPTGYPKLFAVLVLCGSCYFTIVSLAVSHWVYDRSDLYRFRWLSRIFDSGSHRIAVICHSGFDEVSELLRTEMGETECTVLDHYDAGLMSEPSIRRARKCHPPTEGTVAASHDSWPLSDGCADVVFGVLAIHELRSVGERKAWFTEARRVLAPGGKIVLVEHVRDLANFVAFGPGFLHFHSVESWRESWQEAGLELIRAFRITPMIRVFVISGNE